jgi:hypothetical protein
MLPVSSQPCEFDCLPNWSYLDEIKNYLYIVCLYNHLIIIAKILDFITGDMHTQAAN